jgi:hypothetical protein
MLDVLPYYWKLFGLRCIPSFLNFLHQASNKASNIRYGLVARIHRSHSQVPMWPGFDSP